MVLGTYLGDTLRPNSYESGLLWAMWSLGEIVRIVGQYEGLDVRVLLTHTTDDSPCM